MMTNAQRALSQQISPDEHASVDYEQAKEYALRRLSYARCSKNVLAKYLAAKGVSVGIVHQVITRLEEAGVIDDQAYALAITRTRFRERGLARRAIAQELQRKQFEHDVIDYALSTLDDDSEELCAYDLAVRKLRMNANSNEQTRFNQAVGFVARRGYSLSLATEVVRRALNKEHSTH
jgi:regulatory protein